MPCYDSRSNDPAYVCEEVQKRADAATRAACELAKAIRKSDLYNNYESIMDTISSSTQKWVREHEQVDYQRRKK